MNIPFMITDAHLSHDIQYPVKQDWPPSFKVSFMLINLYSFFLIGPLIFSSITAFSNNSGCFSFKSNHCLGVLNGHMKQDDLIGIGKPASFTIFKHPSLSILSLIKG